MQSLGGEPCQAVGIYIIYIWLEFIYRYTAQLFKFCFPIPKDSTVAHPNSNPGIRQWQEKWIRWRRGVLGHDEGDGKENGIYVIWRNASTGEGGHTLNFLSVHFIGTWWILQVYFVLQLCNCEKLKYIGEISSDPRQGHRWAQRWLRWPHVCHAGSGQDQGWQSKGHKACTPSAPKQGCAGTWVGKWAILFCTELLHLAFGGFESYVENELNQTLAHHTCSNTFAWQTRDALKKSWSRWFPKPESFEVWFGSWKRNTMTKLPPRRYPSRECHQLFQMTNEDKMPLQEQYHEELASSHLRRGASPPCGHRCKRSMIHMTSARQFGPKVKLKDSWRIRFSVQISDI